MKKNMKWILGGVALFVVGVLAYFLFWSGKEGETVPEIQHRNQPQMIAGGGTYNPYARASSASKY